MITYLPLIDKEVFKYPHTQYVISNPALSLRGCGFTDVRDLIITMAYLTGFLGKGMTKEEVKEVFDKVIGRRLIDVRYGEGGIELVFEGGYVVDITVLGLWGLSIDTEGGR